MIGNELIELRVQDFLKLIISGFGELHKLKEMIFIEDIHTKVGIDLQLLLILIHNHLDILGLRILYSDKVQRKVEFLTGDVGGLRVFLGGCRI